MRLEPAIGLESSCRFRVEVAAGIKVLGVSDSEVCESRSRLKDDTVDWGSGNSPAETSSYNTSLDGHLFEKITTNEIL